MAMARRRPMLLPALAIMLAGWASFWLCAPAGWRKAAAFTMPLTDTSTSSELRLLRRGGTATHELLCGSAKTDAHTARSGDVISMRAAAAAEEAQPTSETVEIGGFSGFVVGLALLPHVINCLSTDFGVFVGPLGFSAGPFGLTVISCVVTVGLTLWSLGSFVQRGCGLPAGPLGLLGLSEGLAYIGVLGLAVASIATSIRGTISSSDFPSGGSAEITQEARMEASPAPALPKIKPADIQLPEFKIPSNFNTPELRIPEFKPPEFKQPQMKLPDFSKPPRPEGAPDAADKPAEVAAPSEGKMSAGLEKKEMIQKAKRLAKVKAFAAQQEELTED